jgi:hypothetical protein
MLFYKVQIAITFMKIILKIMLKFFAGSSKSETDNSSIGEKFEFKQQDQLCTYTMLMILVFNFF